MHLRTRRFAMGAVAIAGAMALIVPTVALAIGTLDQEQATHHFALPIDSNPVDTVDQEFTAGLTGTLDTVSLYIGRPSTLDATFHLRIMDAARSTFLAEATVPAASVPTGEAGGWVDISDWGAGGPIQVTAGTAYVIRVEWLDTGNGDYSWWQTDGDTYAAGQTWIDNVVQQATDMAFRTYVTTTPPTAPPTASPTLPPTSTVAPVTPSDSGTSTVALVAILGVVTSGAFLLATRRARA